MHSYNGDLQTIKARYQYLRSGLTWIYNCLWCIFVIICCLHKKPINNRGSHSSAIDPSLMQNLNDSLIFWYSSIVWKQIITVAWHKQRRIKDKACHITCQLFWAVRHILVYLNALDNGPGGCIIGKLTPSDRTVTDLICCLFVITPWLWPQWVFIRIRDQHQTLESINDPRDN